MCFSEGKTHPALRVGLLHRKLLRQEREMGGGGQETNDYTRNLNEHSCTVHTLLHTHTHT